MAGRSWIALLLWRRKKQNYLKLLAIGLGCYKQGEEKVLLEVLLLLVNKSLLGVVFLLPGWLSLMAGRHHGRHYSKFSRLSRKDKMTTTSGAIR